MAERSSSSCPFPARSAIGFSYALSREGRAGTTIRMSANTENSVSTVSIAGAAHSNGARGDQVILAEVRE
jgi:hypothetical protein